jgi:hypothetical protein
MTHNDLGLAMGWYFIMSSPEPKLNIDTKDEDNNKKLNYIRLPEPLLIVSCSLLFFRQPAYCQACCKVQAVNF